MSFTSKYENKVLEKKQQRRHSSRFHPYAAQGQHQNSTKSNMQEPGAVEQRRENETHEHKFRISRKKRMAAMRHGVMKARCIRLPPSPPTCAYAVTGSLLTNFADRMRVRTGEIPALGKPRTSVISSGTDWKIKCGNVIVKMRDSETWKLFDGSRMEMIANAAGREMFPRICYDVKGLNSKRLYAISMEFSPMDRHIWKFGSEGWCPSAIKRGSDSEARKQEQVTIPLGNESGMVWNKRGISLPNIKFTNNFRQASKGQGCRQSGTPMEVYLIPNRRYLPRLHIMEVHPKNVSVKRKSMTFVMPKTTFISVSELKEEKIIRLKELLSPDSSQ